MSALTKTQIEALVRVRDTRYAGASKRDVDVLLDGGYMTVAASTGFLLTSAGRRVADEASPR